MIVRQIDVSPHYAQNWHNVVTHLLFISVSTTTLVNKTAETDFKLAALFTHLPWTLRDHEYEGKCKRVQSAMLKLKTGMFVFHYPLTNCCSTVPAIQLPHGPWGMRANTVHPIKKVINGLWVYARC